jgi:hypothetical protein
LIAVVPSIVEGCLADCYRDGKRSFHDIFSLAGSLGFVVATDEFRLMYEMLVTSSYFSASSKMLGVETFTASIMFSEPLAMTSLLKTFRGASMLEEFLVVA